jgi:hypothetical protein
MSAFRAGHLRKAPVAAVKLVGGSSNGMRAAFDSTDVDFPLSYSLCSVWCFFQIFHNLLGFIFPHGGVA